MTRSQALLAAGLVTVAVVAFVVGTGARLGAFGFGSDDVPPGVPTGTVTDAAAPRQPDAVAPTTVGTRREGERRLPVERRGDRREREENDDDD